MGLLSFFMGTTRKADQIERVTPTFSRKPVKRGYSGAGNSARYADFGASNLSADAEIEVALSVLRGRSRNLERNVSHIKRYLQLMQDNIVGHIGFRLQVRAYQTNGKEFDKKGNEAIEAEFNKWCKSVTADGMMTMAASLKMAVRAYCRDGECIIQFRFGKQFPLGFAIKFIEADLLDETLNRIYPGTKNRIRMGVEMDADERPVAYHMLTSHPGESVWSIGNRRYVRVPADEIIHIYLKSRPGQTRGEPPMSAVMNETKMLAGYREAEIMNRRASSSKMGFIERDKDSGPVEGLADEIDDEGELISEVEPGKIQILPEGYSFNSFDPTGSNTDYVGFEKQIIRSIAVGLGPSYIDLGMDLTDVSYSSIRQGSLSDRDFYRGMQSFFIDRMMWPIYRRWLLHCLDFGSTGIPAYRYEKFLNASKFIPRGWAWVDPEKEVDAAIKAREGRLNSLQRQMAENGDDFAEVADEIAAEEAYLASKDIPVVTKNTVAKGEPPQ